MATEHKPREPNDPSREDDEEATEQENPPPQTWKHPDDGKSLSDLDEERPLKP
ncbi:hypothetical protein ACN1C3_09335 [Pseudomonas sp. H11T01]|uniref:hypothetical protein n=1 Tax=Pseudomonas sp. H11T01 TaxID=3402749 RepID=UPI003AC89515